MWITFGPCCACGTGGLHAFDVGSGHRSSTVKLLRDDPRYDPWSHAPFAALQVGVSGKPQCTGTVERCWVTVYIILHACNCKASVLSRSRHDSRFEAWSKTWRWIAILTYTAASSVVESSAELQPPFALVLLAIGGCTWLDIAHLADMSAISQGSRFLPLCT